jgi:threonine/homoserine efflux transporter RhtA
MSTQATTLASSSVDYDLDWIHLLLLVQTVDVILVSINRLSNLTTGYVAANEFLRWVDLLNMLILPLISIVAFYLLKKQIEYDSPAREGRRHLVLNLTFIIGVYLLAASYGAHEVTNYLHVRFCLDDETGDLCRIIIFNDDEFSHWVFFTGFVMVNAALMFLQILFPYRGQMTQRDWIFLVLNGVFIALGIFANLAFEEIGLDLYVVAILAVLSLALFWRRGPQPLVIYYTTAYTLGLVATAIHTGMVG